MQQQAASEPTHVGGGRYRLEAPIGIGRTAVVYRAFDRRLEAPRAVKVLHPFVADDPRAVSRFLDEARTLARVDHPHVLRVFDLGSEEGSWYLVLELAPRALGVRVLREGPLPLAVGLRRGFEIASALSVAHACGVIHRDLRPANVLLGADGRARVADFGTARLRARVTEITDPVGFADGGFAAPELDEGGSDVTVDVYGVGATVLHAITGHAPPFTEEHLRALPEPVARVLRVALRPDPLRRFQKMAYLAREFATAYDALAAATGLPQRGDGWIEDLDERLAAVPKVPPRDAPVVTAGEPRRARS